jgi:hypothetical protein
MNNHFPEHTRYPPARIGTDDAYRQNCVENPLRAGARTAPSIEKAL